MMQSSYSLLEGGIPRGSLEVVSNNHITRLSYHSRCSCHAHFGDGIDSEGNSRARRQHGEGWHRAGNSLIVSEYVVQWMIR